MLAEKLDSYFGISEKGSSIRTEVRGGLIVFFSMAYILIVNPGMMADAGMNADAAFTATVIGSMVAMLIMALYAKFPIAQAPAMGVNAFFAYTVVLIMGYTWQQALAAVFMAGVLFLIISMTGFRKKILDAIPGTMSVAITAGIGFFIAFVGLHGCGLIAGSPTTLVTLGNFGNTSVQVALVGIILTSILYIKKIKGGLLIGILVTAAIGILAGVVSLPDSVISIPAMPDIGAFLDGLTSVQWDLEYLIVIFSFFMLNMFDSAGTIMAVSNTTGLTDEKGNIKDGNKALVSDAVGTVTGAMIGCTTISSYIESATGTEAGAKTGLMVLVVSIMFALALFFGPIFSVIGYESTAGVLLIVGIMMFSQIKNVDLKDSVVIFSTMITILMMVLTYSITNGIGFGFFAYCIAMAASGRYREVNIGVYLISIAFLVYFITFTIF